ncbi:MAG: FKBP-type peptidyl-prolyl cis-trans isomerase [Gemmatimonadales bacterium]
MILTKRILFVVALAAIPLALTSCLGTDSTGVTLATVETTTFSSSLGVDLMASTRTTNGVYVRDVVVGPGAVVTAGQAINIRYSGYLSDGTLFDSNTNAALPLAVTVGATNLIRGFGEGLPGMHIGGTRQLLIPPALAYGANDYNGIPGNSVLVFNVQAVSVQ